MNLSMPSKYNIAKVKNLGHSGCSIGWFGVPEEHHGARLYHIAQRSTLVALLLLLPGRFVCHAQSIAAQPQPPASTSSQASANGAVGSSVAGTTSPSGSSAAGVAGMSGSAGQSETVAPKDPNLQIGGGDLLSLSIFGVPEMSGRFRVEEDGSVSFPLLGVVHAGGLTTNGLERQLASLSVSKELLRDPQVSVQIVEFGTQGITVGGEVLRPGIYPALGGKHLYDILALGGGVGPQAGNVVTVFRHGETMGKQVELQDSLGKPTAGNLSLYPGDTVIVQRAGIVYVLGDVQRPGGYPIDRRTMSVLQALSVAQGPTKTAGLGSARILRKDGPSYHEIPLDIRPILQAKSTDLQLHDGDVLYVPISGLKSFYQASIQGIVATLASASIYALDK